MSAPNPASHDAFSAATVRAAYDAVAADYAATFGDDLSQLALDRAMLDALVARVTSGASVLEVGCGPASAGDYVAAKDLVVVGVDIAFGMLAMARRRAPAVVLAQADMRQLPFRDGSFKAVVAYYSIQHVPRGELGLVLSEVRRVLATDGYMLLATHLGDGDVCIDEFLGHGIEPLGGTLYERDELGSELSDSGFAIEMEKQRSPLPHEADTQRIYLLGRRFENA